MELESTFRIGKRVENLYFELKEMFDSKSLLMKMFSLRQSASKKAQAFLFRRMWRRPKSAPKWVWIVIFSCLCFIWDVYCFSSRPLINHQRPHLCFLSSLFYELEPIPSLHLFMKWEGGGRWWVFFLKRKSEWNAERNEYTKKRKRSASVS